MRSIKMLIGTIVIMLLGLAFLPPLQTVIQGSIHGPGDIAPTATQAPATVPGDVARGQIVYLAKCIGCHAAEAKVAQPHHGEALMQKYKRDDALEQVIRTGRHPMPQFAESYLGDQQLADVIAYLKTLP